MVPIVSVVGRSNAGKTTFLEKLIAELSSRGWRVGTIKHDAHQFEIDKPGKDSWRHARAGSKAVAIASQTKFALIRDLAQGLTVDEIAMSMEGHVDIILTEGYRRGDKPKIEISRSALNSDLLCSADELLAMVTDRRHALAVPHFGLDDAPGVADLLESRFLGEPPTDSVNLLVDGHRVPLEPSMSRVLDRTLRAIVGSLDGCEQAREVTVVLRKRTEEGHEGLEPCQSPNRMTKASKSS